MASDTTLATSGTRTAALATREPAADLLTRLTPDDLHPARLTGPHAWHPWGLTAHPPTDHRVRLVATTDRDQQTLDGLLGYLRTLLQRPSWPPRPPLQIHRHGPRLDCQDSDGRRAVLELTRRDVGPAGVGRDVVNRDGWPIIDELAALNDRLDHIDPDRPARRDLADLGGWVHHKMRVPRSSTNLTCPLPRLLRTQAELHPDASRRLATLLERGTSRTEGREDGPLYYLQDLHRQAARLDMRLGGAVNRARSR